MPGTIFGMKSLPLIRDRKWTRLVNLPRRVLIGVMVTAMCTASLASTAAVNADIPCKQWRFDGYTRIDWADGGKVTFVYRGPYMDQLVQALAFPPNGGPVEFFGGIEEGIQENYIFLIYKTMSGRIFILQGGVGDDGFAYGTGWENVVVGPQQSTSWRIPEPLKCADNGG
jgi:hypothetical protein